MILLCEELAKLVLEESGYIEMWNSPTPDAAGRLDNLKDSLSARWASSRISAPSSSTSRWSWTSRAPRAASAFSIDGRQHAAKGLEFDLVLLPGGKRAFWTQRARLYETAAAVEESAALPMLGLTGARRAAKTPTTR